MAIDSDLPLGPITAAAAPPTGSPPPAISTTANFRRLLESFEQIAAEQRDLPQIADPSSVDDAIAKADAGYSLAMDLRQQLEAAFRQRMR
ncbi:MAG: hypothetical protein KDE27_22850 [Planctomycetes bacterium]|nr:hypothetical protein [Planctomycetota bacterium]